MEDNIIGFAGRLRSGKSTLANICVEHGYKRLYFALPLKNICASFLKITIEELNRLKNSNENINIKINEEGIKFFAKETDIPIDIVKSVIGDKEIKTVRELLQIIGTDLIRSYNMNWHIDRLKKMINPNEKYVFDDVRFPNEKQMIEDMGGSIWFIIRPNMLDNISHHISEESLTWKDFGDHIIINDQSEEYLKFLWENFISNYAKSMEAREKCIIDLSLTNNSKKKNDYAFTLLNSLFIYTSFFNYQKIDFQKDKIEKILINKEGFVTIKYNNEVYMVIDNPFNVEDLKFFLKKDFLS